MKEIQKFRRRINDKNKNSRDIIGTLEISYNNLKKSKK
jgi:hypothetical protein